MKLRSCLALLVATGLLGALTPAVVVAQTTTTTTGGGTTGGGGGGGGGIGSGGGGIGSGAGIGTSGTTVKAPTGSAGSTTSIPSSSNPFVRSYINPLSLGMPSVYANTTATAPAKPAGSFGKGLYLTTTPSASAGGVGSATGNTASFSTIGIPRTPYYSTTLSDEIPFVNHSMPMLQANVKAVIERSSFLKQKENIQVAIDGNVVVLTGQVTSEKQRRLVEGMLRMTPGVREIQNDLIVNTTAKN